MTYFTLNDHNRIVSDWRYCEPRGRSPWTNVRKHAAKHGAAGAWRADGSLVMFYRDGDKIRRTTFKDARPV